MDQITFTPIGVIRSPFKRRSDAPIQPSRSGGATGTVVLREEYAGGLKDLDGFSHVILLYHFDRSNGFELEVIPFLDDVPRGVFATRAPRRPNGIGISVVGLIGIEGNTLRIANVDALDGTPLLDIKPYVREFDEQTDVRVGWLEEAMRKDNQKR